MIHSLSGGELNIHNKYDYAKVQIKEEGARELWFISPFPELLAGDRVLVPYGKDVIEAEVIRIDRSVDEYSFPLPIKRLKKIIKIL